MAPSASSGPIAHHLPTGVVTLAGVLRWRGTHQPNDIAFVFLPDGEHDEQTISYEGLDRRASAIATALIGAGAADSRALLVYDSGLEYIAALYGCLYADVIAVPVYPPDPFRMDRTLPRLRSIVADAGATWLLATDATLDWARPMFRNVPGLVSSLATDLLESGSGDAPGTLRDHHANQPALLQYTSGSTGTPRGVTITHTNLMANLRSIDSALDRQGNVGVLWLPAYHDMGLIGGIFQPVYSGRRFIFMSPVSFMQRPVRWLNAISRYRATITAAPNFAYELCVRKVTAEERAALDLSSLIAALNGAEMVRPETLDRFAQTFAECGFRRESFYPCYGLAEATLMVAGGELERPPVVRSFAAGPLEQSRAVAVGGDDTNSRALVGCGPAVPGQRIVIVEPETRRRLADGQVGEIWVAGESIAEGYWNRPDESAATFGASLTDGGQEHFLRTGDLGFIDQGDLFVAGRRKELIVVRGRNHYPHDIEETVCRSHPSLKADGGAAFSIEVGGEERLAVVQEVVRPRKADPKALIDLIRRRITEVHGVAPAAVALIPAGTLPKTSSGKKQRRACREQILAGSLRTIGEWRDDRLFGDGRGSPVAKIAPHTQTEKKLAAIWSEVLDAEANDVQANFFDLGGQSLLAGQLAARVQEAFAVELPLRTLFSNATIAKLAAWLDGPNVCRNTEALPPVSCADRSHSLPLSSSQQQLWFLEQLENTPRYNLTARIQLHGTLDRGALQRSLAAINARHEALRTTFRTRDGRPEQAIAARAPMPLELADQAVESCPTNSQFNLSTGPLWRARLHRISHIDHHLVITAHHLICDGWSLAIFLKELAELYAAEVDGRVPALHEVEWQFADFAAWQQTCLATTHVERQLEYWKTKLAGASPLDLATDYTRAADGRFRGDAVKWVIGKPTSDALAELGRREGATLYMVLLAAFQTILARYSRQHDVCVGSPVSYRPRREFEEAIGYFVNTLVLRSDLSGEPTFRELLARVRETVLDALANQDAPLPAVVDAVAPRREAGRSPLFNVMFVLENFPWHATDTAGLSLGEIEIDHARIGSYDLGLVVEEQPNGLKASLVYNAELFEPGTIEQMGAAFGLLLAGIVNDPDQSVMRLPLVAGCGRGREGETEGRREGGTGSVQELVAQQVQRTPMAAAIVEGDQVVSYGELDQRANQLAHYLQAMGVGPEVPVAIFLDRSVELVVAMLAVLKVGGAYVPFDPHEGAGRLAHMLADTRPRAILSSRHLARRLPPHEAEEIVLDRDDEGIARHPSTVPDSQATPENLAYIIFTSGSTGRPKGVEVTHASLAYLAQAMAEQYQLAARDRVLQLISPAFDVAAEEIFPTLLRGATLVLGPAIGELTGRSILDVCRQQRITVAHIPPPVWRQCLHEWAPSDEPLFEHLRLLVMGGESPPAEALNRWIELARGRVRVLHEFGLSETTVTNLVYELPAELGAWPAGRKLPIGRPITAAEVYVLDEHRQPVPVGAPGELYVAGPGLARGYHGLEKLTGERFIELSVAPTLRGEESWSTAATGDHSPSRSAGATRLLRLCRTGDLARWLPDGNLEFLGRIDDQIKLRGLRIEPGEIERVLVQHPDIGEAAVIAREETPGGKRLVAYIVPANGQVPEGDSLRAWLRSQLPDSMVPTAFVPLDRLPLNRSHKLDRDALPAPTGDNGQRTYTAPRNEVERSLAQVWQQVLQRERVGVFDNFFELGGDSILTIQVIARAREVGLQFAPRQIFEHQTIAELAAVEGAEGPAAAEQGQVTGDVPLTPIQHWFLSDDVVDPQHFNQAVLLKVEGGPNSDFLPEVFARLVAQHDALRLRFARDTRGWRQWYGAAEGGWPFARFDLSQHSESERQSALTAAAAVMQASLDLERGPLARAAWFDSGAGQARLLLIVHHLVVDAVSWRVLLEDFLTLWTQLRSGQPPVLPLKSTSFKHWSERLADYAQSFDLQNEVAFWTSLAQQPSAVFPRDFDARDNVQSDADVVISEWDASRTEDLVQRANLPYRTQTTEILLAGLAQTLTAAAGGGLLIDVERHGRVDLFDDVDLSRTVGWCTAWHPFALPANDLPPGALLRRSKELLRGVPNQGLGFGLLRYLSADPEIRTAMAALPRPEVSFNYLGRIGEYLPEGVVPAGEPIGSTRSQRASRRHVLEINAYVLDGRLRVDWTYSRRLHRRETIERMAADLLRRLDALVAHCRSPEAGAFTPSDFPLARMTEGELDKLSGLLGE